MKIELTVDPKEAEEIIAEKIKAMYPGMVVDRIYGIYGDLHMTLVTPAEKEKVDAARKEFEDAEKINPPDVAEAPPEEAL